jgi:hypothetical protein
MGWVEETFKVEPQEYADGRYPLPVRFVGGKWVYGPVPTEHLVVEILTGAWACITFDDHDEVDGPRWFWGCNEQTGRSPTLLEAMRVCQRFMAGETGEKETT